MPKLKVLSLFLFCLFFAGAMIGMGTAAMIEDLRRPPIVKPSDEPVVFTLVLHVVAIFLGLIIVGPEQSDTVQFMNLVMKRTRFMLYCGAFYASSALIVFVAFWFV